MKPNIISYLLALLVLASCQYKKKSAETHLRIISMIPGTEATVSIQPKNKKDSIKTYNLQYAKPLEYQTIEPGRYIFTYNIDGNTLLERTYVIGKKGWYTLMISGLKPTEMIKNKKTPMFKLEYIFAGSEATGKNGYLPQWFMIRDNYDGSKNAAYIRFLNASSTYNKLTIHKEGKKYSSIKYPKETLMSKLKPGSYTFGFHHGKIEVGSKKVSAAPGYIYTVITGDPSPTGDLNIIVLKNRSRVLLKQQ